MLSGPAVAEEVETGLAPPWFLELQNREITPEDYERLSTLDDPPKGLGSAVDVFPRVAVFAAGDCNICSEQVKDMLRLPCQCGPMTCAHCMTRWLRDHGKACPNCNQSLIHSLMLNPELVNSDPEKTEGEELIQGTTLHPHPMMAPTHCIRSRHHRLRRLGRSESCRHRRDLQKSIVIWPSRAVWTQNAMLLIKELPGMSDSFAPRGSPPLPPRGQGVGGMA